MKIEILTIFPGIFSGFLDSSLIGKSIQKGLLSVTLCNIRDFAAEPHRKVDDIPYGGGAGMVMKPEPLLAATVAAKSRLPQAPVVLLSASGSSFTQARAFEFSRCAELILVCGRYEGVDQRYIDLCVDCELTIGDYVLMGGEVPAMAVIEACIRLRESVLHNPESLNAESFGGAEGNHPLLEAPQYTRPPIFRNLAVPEVLQGGNHAKISAWKQQQSLEKTKRMRPDLYQRYTEPAPRPISESKKES